jgi:hypothetical protein
MKNFTAYANSKSFNKGAKMSNLINLNNKEDSPGWEPNKKYFFILKIVFIYYAHPYLYQSKIMHIIGKTKLT